MIFLYHYLQLKLRFTLLKYWYKTCDIVSTLTYHHNIFVFLWRFYFVPSVFSMIQLLLSKIINGILYCHRFQHIVFSFKRYTNILPSIISFFYYFFRFISIYYSSYLSTTIVIQQSWAPRHRYLIHSLLSVSSLSPLESLMHCTSSSVYVITSYYTISNCCPFSPLLAKLRNYS